VLTFVALCQWKGAGNLGPGDHLLLSVMQISSSSAGKEVLTSIFSATAETLSTSTTTHVTKVRASSNRAARESLMKATEI